MVPVYRNSPPTGTVEDVQVFVMETAGEDWSGQTTVDVAVTRPAEHRASPRAVRVSTVSQQQGAAM